MSGMSGFRKPKSQTLWSLLIAIAIISLWHVDADAQRRSRHWQDRSNFTGIMSLFQFSEVQAELELSRDEAELVFALQEDLFSEYRNARRDTGDQDGLPTADEVSEKSNALAKRLLSAILRPKQSKRLNELWLQRQGLRAIVDDSLVEALELTDDQKAETQKMEGRLSQGYGRGAINDADAAIAKEITETLTDDQQKRWETMLGKPFDFSTISTRR